MKHTLWFIIILVSLFTISSCATSLTPGGNNVRLVMKEEAPRECTLINDISTGMLGEPDVIGVKNFLRNKTAEMGGNLVVVDTIEVSYNQHGGKYYTGTGRAYKCR